MVWLARGSRAKNFKVLGRVSEEDRRLEASSIEAWPWIEQILINMLLKVTGGWKLIARQTMKMNEVSEQRVHFSKLEKQSYNLH